MSSTESKTLIKFKERIERLESRDIKPWVAVLMIIFLCFAYYLIGGYTDSACCDDPYHNHHLNHTDRAHAHHAHAHHASHHKHHTPHIHTARGIDDDEHIHVEHHTSNTPQNDAIYQAGPYLNF